MCVFLFLKEKIFFGGFSGFFWIFLYSSGAFVCGHLTLTRSSLIDSGNGPIVQKERNEKERMEQGGLEYRLHLHSHSVGSHSNANLIDLLC